MSKYTKPVIVDTSLLDALAILYALLGSWGVLAFINGIPSIGLVAGVEYQNVWAACAAVIGYTTAILVGIRKEKVEVWLEGALVAVAGVYPVAICLQLNNEFTVGRLSVLPIAIAILIIPAWRFLFLIRKNKRTRG